MWQLREGFTENRSAFNCLQSEHTVCILIWLSIHPEESRVSNVQVEQWVLEIFPHCSYAVFTGIIHSDPLASSFTISLAHNIILHYAPYGCRRVLYLLRMFFLSATLRKRPSDEHFKQQVRLRAARSRIPSIPQDVAYYSIRRAKPT